MRELERDNTRNLKPVLWICDSLSTKSWTNPKQHVFWRVSASASLLIQGPPGIQESPRLRMTADNLRDAFIDFQQSTFSKVEILEYLEYLEVLSDGPPFFSTFQVPETRSSWLEDRSQWIVFTWSMVPWKRSRVQPRAWGIQDTWPAHLMYIAPIFPLSILLQTTSYWSHFLSHATLYLHSSQFWSLYLWYLYIGGWPG